MDFRKRLYQQYLTTQVLRDHTDLQRQLVQRAPYLERLIALWIPADRGSKILELGCGYGALLHFLKHDGYTNLQGIDASPEQVIAARSLGLDCVREGSVLESLRQTQDSSYDVVVALDVLEHFTRQEAVDLLDEIFRVLKSPGRLLVHVPNGEAIFAGRIYFGDLTHETCFTRQSIQQLLSIAGFGRIHVTEDLPVVHGMKSALRHVLWRVFRSFFRLIYMAETGDTGRDLVLSQNLTAVAEKVAQAPRTFQKEASAAACR